MILVLIVGGGIILLLFRSMVQEYTYVGDLSWLGLEHSQYLNTLGHRFDMKCATSTRTADTAMLMLSQEHNLCGLSTTVRARPTIENA